MNFPRLKVTLDACCFLEGPDDRLALLAPGTVLLQAETYCGGGTWYMLDLDHDRIASIMKKAGFTGYVSLKLEGKEDPLTAIPKSLALLRKASVRCEAAFRHLLSARNWASTGRR